MGKQDECLIEKTKDDFSHEHTRKTRTITKNAFELVRAFRALRGKKGLERAILNLFYHIDNIMCTDRDANRH